MNKLISLLAPLLLLAPLEARAGLSQRALNIQSAYGTDAVVCEEKLDTTTITIWGGGPGHSDLTGQPWPGVQASNMYINPEDSTTKECQNKEDNGSNGLATFPIESNAGASLTAVTDSYLPTGNTVSHVMKRIGAQVGEIGMHTLAGSAGQTWCIRSYQRWDPTSSIPDRGQCIDANGGTCGDHGTYFTGHVCSPDANNCGNGTQTCCQFEHDQYKVHTLGFFLATPTPHGGNIQMIASFPGSSDGTFDMGMDISSVFGANTNVSAGANPNHVTMSDCMTSWCRFETCLDFMQNGHGYGRHRVTPLSTGVSSTRDMPSSPSDSTQTSIDWATGGNFNHVQVFGEALGGSTHIRYYTHTIMTDTSSAGDATRDFWPGCDSEVEGPGCDDSSGLGGASPNPGKLMWRRGASIGFPLPFMAMSFYTHLRVTQ